MPATTFPSTITVGHCTFDISMDGEQFLGLGKIAIGGIVVRSGRLPLHPYSESFSGNALHGLRLLGINEQPGETRIRLEVRFAPMPTKMMRDHSFDPIHELGDWDGPKIAGVGRLDLVLREATDTFAGTPFVGFSYQYEYASDDMPIFYLLDRASWELEGDIAGATVVNQSSCSDPVVTFGADTAWSTEGVIHFKDDAAKSNPVMTHNLPRWASHQAFDFQYKGDHTLLGVFEHVDLIRTVLCRDAGKAELKCFDKHIFDETQHFATTAKKILLNTERRSEVGQRNLWTWIIQEVHDQARAEFGLQEEIGRPHVAHAYWNDWNIDTFYKDLLPAAINLGVEELWFENVKKSAYSEDAPLKGVWHWNKCANHEYEIAESLGGVKKLKEFLQRARAAGVSPFCWTNNDQAISSPLNRAERCGANCWYVVLEDTRQKWGGAYMGCMHALDFKVEQARRYFIDSHIQIKRETGLEKYLFDSFYNLAFMAVSFADCRPTTMWREVLSAFKELQDAGIHFAIESFGPFGQPRHGCPRSYSLERCWVCYKINLGNDYSTVPAGQQQHDDPRASAAAGLFYALAHMVYAVIPLFDRQSGERIDLSWGEGHRQAIRDYNRLYTQMHRRFLQEDERAVLWHNADGSQALLWNFADRNVALPGSIRDETAGIELPLSASYTLHANHVYAINGVNPLPIAVETK